MAWGWGCWEAPSQAPSVGVKGPPGLPLPPPCWAGASPAPPAHTSLPTLDAARGRGALDWLTAGGPALKPENGASSLGFTRPGPAPG